MEGYLGTKDVTSEHPSDSATNALRFIELYGGTDDDHHRQWLVDQVARILCGCPVTIERAEWESGETELRYSVGTCSEYERWVLEVKEGEDGPDTYSYHVGSAS